MSDTRGSSYEDTVPPGASAPKPAGERRVALVIGNAGYRYGRKLANPHRDATIVADALTELGFQLVRTHTDLELRTLTRALTDFRLEAGNAHTAIIYFAGHGIEIDGQNRLIPVDAELDHVIRVPDETVPLNRLQQAVQDAQRLRVIILDACRDNPFIERMRGLGRMRDAGAWSRVPLEQEPSRSVGRGLSAPQGISSGMIVAYAAAAGQSAQDGPKDGNSPFATALVETLRAEPALDVRLLFGKVHDKVLARTGNAQAPAIYNQLGGETYSLGALLGGEVTSSARPADAPTAPSSSDLEVWRNEWERLEQTEAVADLSHFAEHAHPYFAGKARTRIGQLEQQAAVKAQMPDKPQPPRPSLGADARAAALARAQVDIVGKPPPRRRTPREFAAELIEESRGQPRASIDRHGGQTSASVDDIMDNVIRYAREGSRGKEVSEIFKYLFDSGCYTKRVLETMLGFLSDIRLDVLKARADHMWSDIQESRVEKPITFVKERIQKALTQLS